MERNIMTGKWRVCHGAGFTLVEMMIVVSIVGILATIAAPTYMASVVKAKEAALRGDLFAIRDLLDQHRADQGKYPQSLQALISAGYLRAIPNDPFTTSNSTWQEIADSKEEGIVDIFSGSELVGTNGTPYNRW
jgi:general secretion pathway protein G